MRLRQDRVRTYHLRNRITKTSNEGGSYDDYGVNPIPFRAEVWPAGGKVQAEKYGQRLDYIRNCKVEGAYSITVDDKGKVLYCFDGMTLSELDGICLYAAPQVKPDYRIIAIKPYTPLRMELEKL